MLIETLTAIILYCNGANQHDAAILATKECILLSKLQFNTRYYEDINKYPKKLQEKIKKDYSLRKLVESDVLEEIIGQLKD